MPATLKTENRNRIKTLGPEYAKITKVESELFWLKITVNHAEN